jgi:hypothetical protein
MPRVEVRIIRGATNGALNDPTRRQVFKRLRKERVRSGNLLTGWM